VGEIERTGISAPRPEKLFTLVRGTTSPGSAAIVRDHCRENSRVELRRDKSDPSSISVWLLCPSLRGLVPPESGSATCLRTSLQRSFPGTTGTRSLLREEP